MVRWDRSELIDLIERLTQIKRSMLELESATNLARFGTRADSARNLLHYVVLRRYDVRQLQEKLALLGLSSLGRAEGHVLYNIEAVIRMLEKLVAPTGKDTQIDDGAVDPSRGLAILGKNAERLLGPRPEGRSVRIMVTMPTEAAYDYALVRDLLTNGMDCMRINCAYDEPTEWLRMVSNLRRAEKEIGHRCRVVMDIAGPKLRTGPLQPGPHVARLRPKRDILGRVVSPAVLRFASRSPSKNHQAGRTEEFTLQVSQKWMTKLHVGTKISFEDARGARRSIRVTRRSRDSAWGELKKTAYLTPNTRLKTNNSTQPAWSVAENIPSTEQPILLSKGDTLVISRSTEAGSPAKRSESGSITQPARIGCTLPEALSYVGIGEHIWLDDGKIGGVVKRVSKSGLEVEITHAAQDGTRLLANKGINLPDTDLRLPPLTEKDLEDLKFIAQHADMVGYSFIRTPNDLEALRSQLDRIGRPDMGIVLKIETRRAFEQLPSLLLAALQCPFSGVMIARGDLAVECGYERLAEVQEEILWFCEAAHMPTIWATQVLEGLTKNGIPSRSEVTDAAMGERAECVMLNKGPYAAQAVWALGNILSRMQAHQIKKSSLLRQLSIADSFLKDAGSD